MSFYEPNPGEKLRFGDIVYGFVFAAPALQKPNRLLKKYSIDVEHPPFAVILTPCCSIARGEINIAPLREIRPGCYKNPYLIEDLTRLNRRMTPQQSFPPEAWSNMSQDEKLRQFEGDLQNPIYSFLDAFVYEAHESLPPYDLHLRGKQPLKIRHRMISFKDVACIRCKAVKKDTQIEEGKLLDLTAGARDQLRKKLSSYYGRTPEEDKLALGIV